MKLREEALQRLESLDLGGYAQRRSYLDGNVTHLSAYLRFGILSLAEARDRAWSADCDLASREKFLSELAWHDYYRRVLALLGEGIRSAIEPAKSGWGADAYERTLPDDIVAGASGLACIDAFANELRETGYLHNHARLWFAAYLVHWRKIAWESGARFFLDYLIDGDSASNDLSWQWVASTFSDAPYIFNRANLERYSAGRFCSSCPKRSAGCPFEGEYDAISQALFPHKKGDLGPQPELRAPADRPAVPGKRPERAIVLHHYDAMRPTHPAARFAPDAPALFVNDAALYDEASVNHVGRTIVYAALGSMQAEYRVGDFVEESLRFAREVGADAAIVTESSDPTLRRRFRMLGEHIEVVPVPDDPFVTLDEEVDLRRFSRYWSLARRSLRTAASAANIVPLFSN
ncbi:MAG: deoxyribodipyrimidine photolyase [Candidatus Eremiobacteraeota bacterium]|uniref:Deoxyribodipyrimidine photolyase-like protein (Modular protein) n=1 Tax=mine drainage metagenome TaxID=410659 RepID=E6PEL5_9ZZZZ|nr:deoxyribodipyrimidine photolyase [Candidatus Eremiobacteraeota bacterium]